MKRLFRKLLLKLIPESELPITEKQVAKFLRDQCYKIPQMGDEDAVSIQARFVMPWKDQSGVIHIGGLDWAAFHNDSSGQNIGCIMGQSTESVANALFVLDAQLRIKLTR